MVFGEPNNILYLPTLLQVDSRGSRCIRHSYANMDSISNASHGSCCYDVADNEEPYWEPANVEDELRAQLRNSEVLRFSRNSIQYVDIH